MINMIVALFRALFVAAALFAAFSSGEVAFGQSPTKTTEPQ